MTQHIAKRANMSRKCVTNLIDFNDIKMTKMTFEMILLTIVEDNNGLNSDKIVKKANAFRKCVPKKLT